jgi:hypothetical protein
MTMRWPNKSDTEVLAQLDREQPKTIADVPLRNRLEARGLVRSEPYGNGFVSFLTPEGEALAQGMPAMPETGTGSAPKEGQPGPAKQDAP